MIARRRHDKMEVAIGLSAIAFGHSRLERGRRLFECDPRRVRVAVEFEEAQPEPEQAIRVTVEVKLSCGEKAGAPGGRAPLRAIIARAWPRAMSLPRKPAVAASVMAAMIASGLVGIGVMT